MMLGALIDAGVSPEVIKKQLTALHLEDFSFNSRGVTKNGFSATKVDVILKEDVSNRNLTQIETIVTSSALPVSIIEQAVKIFRRLGEVEARIHNTSIDQVHLHELGGVDTIVDVIGVLSALNELGIEKVYASPVPLGRGFINGAHGNIPLPAPATIALLKGVPIVGVELDVELVTPTGAVLLTSLAESYGKIPSMVLESVGYGAGGRDLTIPNLLRVIIGEGENPDIATFGSFVILETNIDDLNPEVFAYVMDQLFQSGALDVYLTPIQMKKNRPGTLLQVLSRNEHASNLRKILFKETTTLGIRQYTVERWALKRETRTISTPYGLVTVKIAHLGEGKTKVAPEFEDCQKLAKTNKVPIREIYNAAIVATTRNGHASLERH